MRRIRRCASIQRLPPCRRRLLSMLPAALPPWACVHACLPACRPSLQIHAVVMDLEASMAEVGVNQRHANHGIYVLCKAVRCGGRPALVCIYQGRRALVVFSGEGYTPAAWCCEEDGRGVLGMCLTRPSTLGRHHPAAPSLHFVPPLCPAVQRAHGGLQHPFQDRAY